MRRKAGVAVQPQVVRAAFRRVSCRCCASGAPCIARSTGYVSSNLVPPHPVGDHHATASLAEWPLDGGALGRISSHSSHDMILF